jgi:NADH dehydrogenase
MFTDSSGTCLDCDMAIWTAGINLLSFIENLDFPKKNGWILVDAHLLARDNVFAIGDCAWVEIDGLVSN